MADELFKRSNLFRRLLVADLPDLLKYAIGVSNCPLPPPKDWTCRLKAQSLATVRSWHDKFGAAYPEVRATSTLFY